MTCKGARHEVNILMMVRVKTNMHTLKMPEATTEKIPIDGNFLTGNRCYNFLFRQECRKGVRYRIGNLLTSRPKRINIGGGWYCLSVQLLGKR